VLLIKKFGGTSVGTIERIKNVAKNIVDSQSTENKIVVVVSAMTNVTNEIYNKLLEISDKKIDLAEFDQAMVTGEQISASLLAIAINKLGVRSISYNAINLPIYANGVYGDGDITQINVDKIKQNLVDGVIPVITGFQGWNQAENRFMTLGRGGSDYSAVMIAAAMNADLCYIYTDVNGVYTCDPNFVSNSIKIDEICYKDMIDIANDGAKVLQTKSVIAAKKYNIQMKVLSSFSDDSNLENRVCTKVLHKNLLQKQLNIKVISYKDNFIYFELDNKNGIENAFYSKYQIDKGKFLVQKDVLLDVIGSTILHDITKITVRWLGKNCKFAKEDLSNFTLKMKSEKIDFVHCYFVDNVIVFLVKREDKKIVLNLAHHFFNGEYL
jgi:aspartate kinase